MRTKMTQALDLIRHKCHWEMLEKLEQELDKAASSIGVIHSSFSDIANARQRLAGEVAEIHIILEFIKMKLSIMEPEFKERVDALLDQIIQEEKPVEPNFDEMEF